jgi:hypothetical protein
MLNDSAKYAFRLNLMAVTLGVGMAMDFEQDDTD